MSSKVQMSRIVHGHWRLAEWNLSKKEILSLVERVYDLGVSTIDHADIYGGFTCEELFGEALALNKGLRKKLQIVTKCGIQFVSSNRPEIKSHHYNTSKEHIIKSAERSLKNFKTDYLDVLLIHRPDPYMNPEEVAEAFAKLRQEGKVLEFGVSNFKPSQFNVLSSYLDFPLVTNQIEISPLNFEHFDYGTIDLCLEKRIHPMAWSPLGGGRLFKDNDDRTVRTRTALEKVSDEVGAKSIDEVAYAWLLNHPAKIIPIVGSGSIDRVKVAVNALNIKLTRDQWFEIWQSSLGRDID